MGITNEQNENTKRSHIFVDDEDWDKFHILLKRFPFKNNLHCFAMATFIGYYEVGDYKPVKKQNPGFVHLSVFPNSPYLDFLKALAICDADDPMVLDNEKEMYSICEGYARTGVDKLIEWIDDPDFDFKDKIAEIMLDKFEEIGIE